MSDAETTLTAEVAHLAAETREIDLLVDSTNTEIARLRQREEQARLRYDGAKAAPGPETVAAADDYLASLGRRMTMDAQLAALQAKHKLLTRVAASLGAAQAALKGAPLPAAAAAAPAPAPAAARADGGPRLDEARLLQAVVDTQEEERRRVARQVHDGPAQAMANVVLQSEISERLYEVDQKRSREELAGLRQMVNKTLQELRGFIFELRPMILDDLGLVPTLRRYTQTLVEKHQVKIDLASSGRDRRLESDQEVAIFRLIQDSLNERIERAVAKDISLALEWRDEVLEISLRSDGRELPIDTELSSGLRRSERLELLHGEQRQDGRDGRTTLYIKVPVARAPQLIS